MFILNNLLASGRENELGNWAQLKSFEKNNVFSSDIFNLAEDALEKQISLLKPKQGIQSLENKC